MDQTTVTDEQPNFGDWLFAWGKKQRLAASDAVPRPTPERPDIHEVADDGTPRSITDPQAYGRRALDAAVDNVRNATEGFRNHTLNAAAYSLGRLVSAGLLDEGTARDTLHTAAEECGLSFSEIGATVSSGLYSGMARPISWVKAAPLDPLAPFTPSAASPLSEDELDAYALKQERARRKARRVLDQEEALAQYHEPLPGDRLDGYLLQPDEDQIMLLDGLLPRGANVTLTAPFKTGKTTMVGELIRALADGGWFLGNHQVAAAGLVGDIALWDYEMSPNMHRRWLRDLDIQNQTKVWINHFRGHSFRVGTDAGTEFAIEWLREREIGVWIIDPFARAFLGDENDNGAVTEWTDRLDRIKYESGVHTIVMPVHTGRREGDDVRARGATRLDDWPDVRWLLRRDGRTGGRYFAASGRDVDVEEVGLSFDPATRRLAGDLPGTRTGEDKLAAVLASLSPLGEGEGRTKTQLREIAGASSARMTELVAEWTRERKIAKGTNGNYFLPTVAPFSPIRPDLD